MLVFKTANQKFAVNAEDIDTVIENNYFITRVPKSADYLYGIINLRGNIIPVINFKKLLQISSNENDKNIIILKIENDKIGISVDIVDEVVKIDDSSIEKQDEEEIINLNGDVINIINNNTFKNLCF